MVTTTDSTVPSADVIGVTLISIVTRRPSGTETSMCSARTVSAPPRTRVIGSSARANSRPSEKRQIMISSSCSGG